jgi:SAM-dependent methyltransferase
MLASGAPISPNDQMYVGGDLRHYRSVGSSAMEQILAALALAGRSAPRRILDLPSGHGRVLRKLRARYREAEITACDLERDGVDFCAATFGAVPVYGRADIENTALTGKYDLIWCGSLFTHMDEPKIDAALRLFLEHLSGVLVFTMHGRRAEELYRSGYTYLDRDHERFEAMLETYRRTGFAYGAYRSDSSYGAGLSAYGVSLALPSWVMRKLESCPSVRVLMCHEAGWDNHHDVYACVSAS